mgnify:FL=1
MNLGQFLTAKSPLPNGTVAQHLAAIAASVGTGTGETVFASMFSVQIEQVEQIVSTRRERPAIYSPPALREVVSISAPVTSEIIDQPRSITVFQATPSTFVYASQEVVIVSETVRRAWVKTDFGSGVAV